MAQQLKLPNLNKIVIAGRVAREPGFKEHKDGYFYSFLLVYSKKRKKDDEWIEETLFIPVKGFCGEYLTSQLYKGVAVMIEGELNQEHWESADGSKKNRIFIYVNKLQVLTKTHTEDNSNKKDGEVYF